MPNLTGNGIWDCTLQLRSTHLLHKHFELNLAKYGPEDHLHRFPATIMLHSMVHVAFVLEHPPKYVEQGGGSDGRSISDEGRQRG